VKIKIPLLITLTIALCCAHVQYVWAEGEDMSELQLDDDSGGGGSSAGPAEESTEFDEFQDVTTEPSKDEKTQEADKDKVQETKEQDKAQEKAQEAPPKEPEKAQAPEPVAPVVETPPPTPKDEPPPPPIVAPAEPPPPEVPAVAGASDEPDQALEKRLYQIYLKYQQKQIPDSEWMSIAGDKSKEEYKIQPGNNLWDISRTVFGDGNFWPKVWSMNGAITNPHLVVPGQKIVFTPGDISGAPKVAFAEATETTTQTTETAGAHIEIPPPSRIYPPVLDTFPPSLAMNQVAVTNRDFDQVGFDGNLKDPVVVNKMTSIVEQAVDTPPHDIGKIVEIEGEDRETASTYQYVFLKSTETLQTGDHLMSFHMKPHSTPEVMQIEADLSVTDVLGNGTYKLLIVKSIDPVHIGSLVVHGQIAMTDFDTSGSSSGTRSTILGGIYDADRAFATIGDLVFLDKPLAIGDVLSVVVNSKSRNPDSQVNTLGQPVGLVKVVSSSEKYATAVVTDVMGPIYTGDFTTAASLYKNPSGAKPEDLMDLDKELEQASPETPSTPAPSGDEILDKEGIQDTQVPPTNQGLSEDLSTDDVPLENSKEKNPSEGSDIELDGP
jgi:hypothetical protein